MKKILILGGNNLAAKKMVTMFHDNASFNVKVLSDINFDDEGSYIDEVKDVNIIYSFLGPMDVDLNFEALFSALDEVNPPLEQFVMLSTAGIDNELNEKVTYNNVDNAKEYLNEQRYAVKLVDEYEVPYTVLRPVEMTQKNNGKLKIIDEGKSMDYGKVSFDNVANVAYNVVVKKEFINQSIGLIEEK
ncbi:NAD(P)-dependent oxidoreductase [Apilactobacillus micheneri]|uniref:NAD(P)-dependent oxidoreductase n=1 Tax=Apilactobacillus micheneri TaxID=1899430 RepID=A0ABY2Z319_9LACO|nr:NAD(P)H-binding protein [Apilactobacillus micheneri]TPR26321.1 NAD(P)-dependent oxidoreductase [Apilactobacillus micheneri]TPR27075.1 NAD(P)-dependent oxidoreductase [Apilactobacillus micheneri]TPR27933.1 NAD(P)-dependent oxidoreductase [Apilactobacillus micheneri]TPR31838.1 NAD(P)-dependent oxidoreductase [Apilactobacillus micheneri]TPR32242.1 NAD(P)-dependent oxidoreductase [Apilactobacillus micheneri]